jgi:hypothetical protein
MKPTYKVEYLPDSDFYQATCDKYPTLTIMDTSPLEALRRIIVWVNDRIVDAS